MFFICILLSPKLFVIVVAVALLAFFGASQSLALTWVGSGGWPVPVNIDLTCCAFILPRIFASSMATLMAHGAIIAVAVL